MAIATDIQVQNFTPRIRTRAEQLRGVIAGMVDDETQCPDVKAALSVEYPTWTDQRTTDVPHQLTPSDLLAIFAFEENIIALIDGTLPDSTAILAALTVVHTNLPIFLSACVRPLGSNTPAL